MAATSMWCPLCARRLERDEFQRAVGDVPNRWMCGDCDCMINEHDDEYEQPDWLEAEPADAQARGQP